MSAPPESQARLPITRVRGGAREELDDTLAVEEPLEIRLGYTDARAGRKHRSLSITMRTPGHDMELATGFLFSEGIIQSAADIDFVAHDRDNVVKVELQARLSLDLSRLERHFYTTSSCGVCGKASLEQLSLHGAEALLDNDLRIREQTLYKLGATLREHQHLFRATGGNHAAAAFETGGEILLAREDVGRHNALDKLVGHMLSEGDVPMRGRGIMVSGRASFELMQKALMARCPLLVAVGAPSSLAVELAQEYNIILVGFLHRDGFNIYHGAEHIV